MRPSWFMLPLKKQSYCVLRQIYDTFWCVLQQSLAKVRLCVCFILNFVLIYVVLVHVLRWNHSSQNPRTIGCTWFSRHNFGLCLLLQNRYRIYAKFRTHLCCFSSRFTLESARARTPLMIGWTRFSRRILGPICCYKTDIGFTLNFVLIYAVLAYGLRWNPPEPEPEPHTAWFMLSSTCHYAVVNAVGDFKCCMVYAIMSHSVMQS
jgi:hypothetical protein